MLNRSKTVINKRSHSNPDVSENRLAPRFSTIERQQSTHSQRFTTYSQLPALSVHSLQLAALKRINALLKRHKMKPVDPSTLSAVSQSATSSKRKWWSIFSPHKKLPVTSVMGEFLCKSIEFASVPVDSTEHSFNIRRIPILVHECANYLRKFGLETKGVFRVSGNEKRIAELISEFDNAPTYGLGCSFNGKTVHDVASFLKKYLRNLPEPLFSSDLYPYFLSTLELPSEDGSRSYAIRLLLYLLPPTHLILLEYLLVHLDLICQNSSENQMTAYNLGLIFAPTLLRGKNKTPVEEYEKLARLIEYMIMNYHQFIITHPDRDPEECLDKIFLPRLPHVYAPSMGYTNLDLAKPTAKPPADMQQFQTPETSPLLFQMDHHHMPSFDPIIDVKREETPGIVEMKREESFSPILDIPRAEIIDMKRDESVATHAQHMADVKKDEVVGAAPSFGLAAVQPPRTRSATTGSQINAPKFTLPRS